MLPPLLLDHFQSPGAGVLSSSSKQSEARWRSSTQPAFLRHLVTRTLLGGLVAEIESCAWLASFPVT